MSAPSKSRGGRPSLLGRLMRRLGREDGTASVEFVVVLPVLFLLFTSSVEAGFMQLRYVMLERGLDLTVRELRLGQLSSPTQETLRKEICRLSLVIPDCVDSLMVELQPVDTSTWQGMTDATTCVDRSQPVGAQQPPNVDPGSGDEMMLIRACAVFNPVFPMIGLGLQLAKDAKGTYHLSTTSAFVNEPS